MNQIIIDKILLIGATLSIILALLFFIKKSKALHDYILISWLIFLGLYVGVYAFSTYGFLIDHSWIIDLFISLLFINGPLLFFYVKSITHSEFKLRTSALLHLLPVFFFAIYINFVYPGMDILVNAREVHHMTDIKFPYPYFIFLVLLALSVPVYIYLSTRLLIRHRKIIKDNFSDTEKRTLSWLRNLITIFGIAWIALISIIFIHHVLLWFSDSFCINGIFITLSAFIIMAGYFGFLQPQIFISDNDSLPIIIKEGDKPYSGSSLKEEVKQQYLTILNEHMKKEKPYLNNQLTLHKLSTELNIPLHHLSRIINEHFNQNFFDFINQFRIAEFMKRLDEPKYSHFSILGIAFDCGFNSKTTFNRYFKKATGLTPSGYKSTHSV